MSDVDGDEEFQQAGAGASLTYPMEAGKIRKGMYINIKGRPCRVVDVSTSKTGKHGHAKAHFVATEIFTNKKMEELCPASHNAEVPFVSKATYQLIDIAEDGFVSLMDGEGNMKDDLQLPEDDVGREIQTAFDDGESIDVQTISAMGTSKIVGWSKNTKE